MGEWIGKDRKARRCYGFDEIALVPGAVTINPEEVDTSWEINGRRFPIPFLASAMDGVVDPKFAVAMGKLGGLAVLNLEGIYTRYDDYGPILKNISETSPEKATELVQKIYVKPVNEKLIARRIREIKKAKVPAVVSTIPQHAERFGKIAQEAGCDIFVIQSTVTTVRHVSKAYQSIDLKKICKQMKIPVIVGNSVTYQVAIELMETGIKIGRAHV